MLVLASASPRRQSLLKQIGCAFRVVISEAEEINGASMTPEQIVMENARRKAMEVAYRLSAAEPVLGADTVVAVDSSILGKPLDEADAAHMLRQLSGRVHVVYTGIALVNQGEVFSSSARTNVWFDKLSEKEISDYIATGEPLDKAGAYAVQGQAAKFIVRLEGSFSNVVGLPLYEVRKLAERAGISI